MIDFPILSKKIDGKDIIVFFDIEGTGFTHKVISLSFIGYQLKDRIQIGEKVFSYQRYILCQDKIGKVVSELTGIDKDLLKREGIKFEVAIKDIINLLRPYKRRVFISYSSFDLTMIKYSIDDEIYQRDFFANIKNNYFDFYNYLTRLICDDKGYSLSIQRLLKRFKIEDGFQFHNSLDDALALKEIYSYIVLDKERFIKEIIFSLKHNYKSSIFAVPFLNYYIENHHVDDQILYKIIEENI